MCSGPGQKLLEFEGSKFQVIKIFPHSQERNHITAPQPISNCCRRVIALIVRNVRQRNVMSLLPLEITAMSAPLA